MMRIAYVLPFLQRPSGWRNHAVSFLNAIRRHVMPFLFVSEDDFQAAGTLFPDLPIFALPVTQFASLATRTGPARLAKCYWTIRRGHYPDVDLVHSMEAYPTGLVGMWLSEKLHRPHAITIHGTYGILPYERRLDRAAYEQVLRHTALICPVSHGSANLLREYFGKSLSQAVVQPILNGNDYHRSVPREQALQHVFPETPMIISVGDVKPRKGQHISLAAFAKVKAARPDARYCIIGKGTSEKYMRKLEAFIAEQNLPDVSFAGGVPDAELQRCYQEASLFLLTPQMDGLHYEGFGLVYLGCGQGRHYGLLARSGGR
jgi:glycosyltransferase involved in cell wall biosynthesis